LALQAEGKFQPPPAAEYSPAEQARLDDLAMCRNLGMWHRG
jgi:hypothetical protein